MFDQINAVRKGGNVQRFHTTRLLHSQDVAQHSFNSAMVADMIAKKVVKVLTRTPW